MLTITAPRIGPISVPLPPIITMTTKDTDRFSTKVDGLM